MNTGKEILARIERRMAALGLSRNAVGVQSGLTRDIIRSIERNIHTGRQRGVSSSTLAKLAPVLRTTPQWLLTGQGVEDAGDRNHIDDQTPEPPAAHLAGIEGNVELADIRPPNRLEFPRDVPVLGTAAGSIVKRVEGFQLEHEVVDYVRRPPALIGIQGIYAIYVSGISMVPLHNDRDLRFVDPKQRPMIGDSVIVLTKHHEHDPGQAYIKILRKRTPGSITLEQMNPQAVIEVPLKYVISVHRVLTINDLFGV